MTSKMKAAEDERKGRHHADQQTEYSKQSR